MSKIILIVQLLWLVTHVNGYKILAIFPYPMKSHFETFHLLLQGLQNQGHELTVISHFDPSLKRVNFTHVNLNGSVPVIRDILSIEDFGSKYFSRIEKYMSVALVASIGKDACKGGLKSPALQQFLGDLKERDTEYDVIIAEFFSTDCFLALRRLLSRPPPIVALSSSMALPWTHEQLGNKMELALDSLVFLDYYPGKMDFFGRVENFLAYLGARIAYKWLSLEAADAYVREYVDSNASESVAHVADSTSLLLVNTHFSLMGALAKMPNVVDVGGIHIPEVKPLPSNIEKWINESKDGVIYFSMGSMIKGHTFPEEKRKMFLRAFGRLKQRVLWKWENETMPFKPDNVMIQKWMPQFDILCHPNVKAFIAHGGLLGTTEAVHCGVPVVVMPQFGDQHTNARALEAGGGGVVLNFREADEEMVYNALKTVLDPEFNKKAKELSARFRDRPMSPMDTAIYWIEYVARHKGAHHMRTAAVGMPLYQYLLLDVFAFLGICALTILIVAIYITKFFWRMLLSLFSSGEKKQKVKKN